MPNCVLTAAVKGLPETSGADVCANVVAGSKARKAHAAIRRIIRSLLVRGSVEGPHIIDRKGARASALAIRVERRQHTYAVQIAAVTVRPLRRCRMNARFLAAWLARTGRTVLTGARR